MRLRRQQPAEATGPALAFCERALATASSPEHIRRVGQEGLKLGGGVPEPALCGLDLRGGWDLEQMVTVDAVRRLGSPREGDGRQFLCSGCRDEGLRILGA